MKRGGGGTGMGVRDGVVSVGQDEVEVFLLGPGGPLAGDCG